MSIVLSPSSLSDFAKCRRCWWLDKVKGIKWPRGIFPSLPGGIDRVLKDWYDHFRVWEGPKLPPELDADGRLDSFSLYPHQDQLRKWRFWKTGLKAEVAPGVIVSGALDDLLAPNEERTAESVACYAMLDYKTRGAPPKPGDTEKYYGIQANCYSLMLDATGMKTGGRGFFIYYWPAKQGVKAGSMPSATCPITDFSFETEIVEVPTEPRKAADLAIAAAQCLDGPMPEKENTCEQCHYSHDLQEYLLHNVEKAPV